MSHQRHDLGSNLETKKRDKTVEREKDISQKKSCEATDYTLFGESISTRCCSFFLYKRIQDKVSPTKVTVSERRFLCVTSRRKFQTDNGTCSSLVPLATGGLIIVFLRTFS